MTGETGADTTGGKPKQGALLGNPNTVNITITRLSNGKQYTLTNDGDVFGNEIIQLGDAVFASKLIGRDFFQIAIYDYDQIDEEGNPGTQNWLRIDLFKKPSSGDTLKLPVLRITHHA